MDKQTRTQTRAKIRTKIGTKIRRMLAKLPERRKTTTLSLEKIS